MNKIPYIGITCDISIPNGKIKEYELVCDHRYAEAVKQAGGFPVLLPIASRRGILERILREINGLVIVGGDDVNPRLYGEKPKKGTGTVFGPRLQFEKSLYRMACLQKIPILGICYGMQLINVLEGGTLFQDIRRDAKSKMVHNSKRKPLHEIQIEPNSRLSRILGSGSIMVHSEHHQAVCRVAPGFRPISYAEDGIIEAIEGSRKEILAVQWHPERTLDSPATRKLFRFFVNQC